MSKFTPGPWKFERADDGNWHIRDAAGTSMMCDEHYYPWVPNEEADWHLISAAPEMYEALETIAGFAPGNGDVCEIIARRARKALARVWEAEDDGR